MNKRLRVLALAVFFVAFLLIVATLLGRPLSSPATAFFQSAVARQDVNALTARVVELERAADDLSGRLETVEARLGLAPAGAQPAAAATTRSTPRATSTPLSHRTPPATGKDIIDTASAAGQFEILVLALELAGLTDSLKDEGPFTFFAPTDTAFAALPEATLDALLADPTALAEVLRFHIIPARLRLEELTGAQTATSLQGSVLTITANAAGSVTVNDATVLRAELEASNGVLYAVNRVLLPENW